jgi:MoxR-like ATPase
MIQSTERQKEDLCQKEKYYTIDGQIYPAPVIDRIIARLLGDSALAIVGDPGGGKTYFTTKGLPVVLEDLFGIPYVMAYTQPFQLKSASDTYCRPSLRQGDLVWELTWPIQLTMAARKEGKGVLFVVEEFNRMDARGQNFLLELCGSKVIHIEQTGDRIELPPYSRVCLIGNSKGSGVSQKHEALYDRLAIVQWPIPAPQTMAKMLFARFSKADCNEFRARKPRTSFGGCLAQRELTIEIAEALADVAHSMNSVRKEPVSLRGLERCVSLYMSIPELESALDCIIEEELARDLEKNEREVKRSIVKAKDRLRLALIINRRGRS